MIVYFLRAQGTDFVKIGSASSIDIRINQLQTGCPHTLVLFNSFEGGKNEEKAMHALFRDRKVKNEWFLFHEDMTQKNVADYLIRRPLAPPET